MLEGARRPLDVLKGATAARQLVTYQRAHAQDAAARPMCQGAPSRQGMSANEGAQVPISDPHVLSEGGGGPCLLPGPFRPGAPSRQGGDRRVPGSWRRTKDVILSTRRAPYQGVHSQDAAARQLAPYQGVHPQDAAARQPAPYQGVHPHESAVRIQAGAGGWTRLERIHAPVLDPARPAAAAGGGSRNRRVKRWRRAWRVAAGADPWPHAGSSSARGRCRRACWRSGPSGV